MLVERVRDILLHPKNTWVKIKDESVSFGQVLTNYAIPLAAIPAVFGLLGLTVVGISLGVGNIVYRISVRVAFLWAVVYYVLTLVGLYLEGIIINALAPSFNSQQSAVDAFKLAVYSSTPAFVAGILNLVPQLRILSFLLSLYGIYLLYIGLPIMMKTPKDKAVGYLIVAVVVVIVVYLIVGAAAGSVLHIP